MVTWVYRNNRPPSDTARLVAELAAVPMLGPLDVATTVPTNEDQFDEDRANRNTYVMPLVRFGMRKGTVKAAPRTRSSISVRSDGAT